MWGTDDNILTNNNQPLHEIAEDLLYRHELKDLLQKHVSESRITNTTPVGSLQNAPLIAARESIARVMEKPRVLVHAAAQHDVALVTEEKGLLEEPPYEWLFPSEHQCDDQFATCTGYFSAVQKIRRFRYEDNNVAIVPVQPHYYCVRWV